MSVEPPSPEKKARGRRLYSWALITAIPSCLAWLALFYVLVFYPKNRPLHDMVGFTALISGGVWLLIYAVLSFLGAGVYVDVGSYTLPYRVKISPLYGWASALFLAFLIFFCSPQLLYNSNKVVPFTQKIHLDALNVLSFVVFLVLPWAGCVCLIFWRSITIYEDHLVFTKRWQKQQIFFRDIYHFGVYGFSKRLEDKGKYILVIRYQGDGGKPFEFNLTMFDGRGVVILLNEIDNNTPRASINEIALQLKYGDMNVR